MGRTFVVFDVASDVAHFRRPYAITSALTFPFPTRTALCGLVGAVLGLPKDECLAELTDTKAVFCVQIMKPLRVSVASFNLLHTKDSKTFRPKAETPHAPKRYELIQEPHYRVYFSHDELGLKLHTLLENGECHFTPCLGLAWMIAWFPAPPFLVDAEWITADQRTECLSPIRTSEIRGDVVWRAKGIYQRIRMPAEMRPDRVVTRYEEYLVDTTGGAIRADLGSFWRLPDGTTVSPM
jgi:CRISPR-associated protein Cas5h